MQDDLKKVHEALCRFIVNATKENAPSYAVQALPEAIRALVDLTTLIRHHK